MLTFPKKASTYFLKFTFREKKIIKIQGCTRKEYVIIFLKFFSQELFEGMIDHFYTPFIVSRRGWVPLGKAITLLSRVISSGPRVAYPPLHYKGLELTRVIFKGSLAFHCYPSVFLLSCKLNTSDLSGYSTQSLIVYLKEFWLITFSLCHYILYDILGTLLHRNPE